MRKWLIGIIKEALQEQKINTITKILADRKPTIDDFRHEIGTVWLHEENQYYLESVEANWIKYDPKEEV